MAKIPKGTKFRPITPAAMGRGPSPATLGARAAKEDDRKGRNIRGARLEPMGRAAVQFVGPDGKRGAIMPRGPGSARGVRGAHLEPLGRSAAQFVGPDGRRGGIIPTARELKVSDVNSGPGEANTTISDATQGNGSATNGSSSGGADDQPRDELGRWTSS